MLEKIINGICLFLFGELIFLLKQIYPAIRGSADHHDTVIGSGRIVWAKQTKQGCDNRNRAEQEIAQTVGGQAELEPDDSSDQCTIALIAMWALLTLFLQVGLVAVILQRSKQFVSFVFASCHGLPLLPKKTKVQSNMGAV